MSNRWSVVITGKEFVYFKGFEMKYENALKLMDKFVNEIQNKKFIQVNKNASAKKNDYAYVNVNSIIHVAIEQFNSDGVSLKQIRNQEEKFKYTEMMTGGGRP